MKGLHKFINWYTQHFSFPHKGWKYFKWFLQRTHLYDQTYLKKIVRGLYINVNPSDHIQQQLFWYGFYEKDALLTWHSLIERGFVVLDIGANVGLYSLLAADKVVEGRVYAFEPATILRKQLDHNIRLNNFKTITTLPYAAGDMNGTLPFYIAASDNLGMSGFCRAHNFSGVAEHVDSIRLDDWAKEENLKQLDAVKIDVEGAEMLVLSGMSQLLETFKPLIFIEVLEETLERFDHKIGDIYSLLSELHYLPYEIMGINKLRSVKAIQEGDTIVFLPANHRLPNQIVIIND